MEIFKICQVINNYLNENNHFEARNELVKLLDFHNKEELQYSPLINHLIRQTGLYPYIQTETASWDEKFIYEAFKVDIGGKMVTLHREQSNLLSSMVQGKNIAVSAPTSFGKSFVIDAFIALNRPKNVVIIVPTIALADETRRRIYKKFSDEYKIITTPEVELSEKNILIFPQERAVGYLNKLDSIDLLIIDEFYKASFKYDKQRSPSLLKAILKLGKKSKQKYFLAPNIKSIKDNVFTQDMEFMEMLDFNTVFLEKHELYKEIKGDEVLKKQALLTILKKQNSKTLIYAGTYSNIDAIAGFLIAKIEERENKLLTSFALWLAKNYAEDWQLTNLVKRGIGIHNGQLHRSLSQIQIKLFEERDGFDSIISTSSIIEGVNTSAENVVVWKNKDGPSKLKDFTYKNIIGRGGRMLKHFIGKIYILDIPPEEENTQLDIPFPDTILGDLDEEKYKESLTNAQVDKIIAFKRDMYNIIGKPSYDRLLKDNVFQNSNSDFIKDLARSMKESPEDWNGLAYLNSSEVDRWDRLLYKIIKLQPGNWDIEHRKFVSYIKILSQNWYKTIPELLVELKDHDIGINQFFKLEKNVTYKMSSLLSDVNELQKEIFKKGVDVAPFVSKLSHAFLPAAVYQLEEYGLPRMISKKLHRIGAINFLDENLTLHKALQKFENMNKEKIIAYSIFDEFDGYILDHFYDGITLDNRQIRVID